MSQATEVDRESVHVGDTIRHVDDEYSTETRERVAEHILEYWPTGVGIRELAREAGVSEATVRAVLEDYFEPVSAGANAEAQEVIGMGDGEMDESDEAFESRVVTLAEWFGISDTRARTLATAEEEAGITLTGDEAIQEVEDQPDGEAWAAVADAGTDDGDTLSAYRLGFQDGFQAAKRLGK